MGTHSQPTHPNRHAHRVTDTEADTDYRHAYTHVITGVRSPPQTGMARYPPPSYPPPQTWPRAPPRPTPSKYLATCPPLPCQTWPGVKPPSIFSLALMRSFSTLTLAILYSRARGGDGGAGGGGGGHATLMLNAQFANKESPSLTCTGRGEFPCWQVVSHGRHLTDPNLS